MEEVKKAHPYEEPGIDIYPAYEIEQNKLTKLTPTDLQVPPNLTALNSFLSF